MHYLYKITNQLNNKIYIGQSNNGRRWSQHKYFARHPEQTGQHIHNAMAKYGVDNFIFEIIATCRTQVDADEVETILIYQYNSRDKTIGYNSKIGGIDGRKGSQSEETREKIRQATIKQIAEKGHPARGRIVTDEEKELHRKARLEKPLDYTPELRQKMSEAHIGIKDTEETKQKKSESAAAAWEKRIDYSRKCSVPGCEVEGKAKYKIINNIRYCNKHGLRMLRYGRLDCLNA